ARVIAQAEEGDVGGNGAYRLKRREVVAQTETLRVVVLTLAEGQSVPWHRHTHVTDTFVCMEGPMCVETREPDHVQELVAGQMYAVPAGQPHYVHGKDMRPCRFTNIQGIGHYDFVPIK